MGKILFWFILIVAVLFAGRLLGHAAAKRAARARQPAPPRPTQSGRGPVAPVAGQGSEEMVRCAHCGIHLPRSEALLQQGKTWCGSEHARLGARPERTH